MTGEELADRRVSMGLTQKQLAGLLLTPLSTFVRWEQGRSRIPGAVEIALEVIIRDRKEL